MHDSKRNINKRYIYNLIKNRKFQEVYELAEQDGERFNEIIREMMNKRKYLQLEKIFNFILVKEPKSLDVLNTYAKTLLQRGRDDQKAKLGERLDCLKKAIGYFDKALKIEPGHVSSLIGKGMTFWTLGRLGIEVGGRDIIDVKTEDPFSVNPNDLSISIDVTPVICGEMKKHLGIGSFREIFEKLIQCLDKVTKLAPQRAELWAYQANAYCLLGQREKAEECRRKALEINKSLSSEEMLTPDWPGMGIKF